MKIIVHAGMHKTGSTSLQLAFADANAPDFHYLHGDHENFSMSMFLLFEDEDRLENHLYHRISQTSKSDLLARRKKLRAKIEKQIESHSKPVLLVSGEDISGFNGRVVGRLAEFLQSYSSDIQVITYVRPPCAYMESAFQERLKHQLVEADPTLLWPRYQRRLSNVVRAFGVENNTFVKFDRSDLCNGNVIDDFSRRSGLSRPNDVAREFNSSVSAEAVALTYAYRKLIRSEPPQGAKMSHVDMVFRTRLAEIGTSKLRFDAGFREKAMRIMKVTLPGWKSIWARLWLSPEARGPASSVGRTI